jgi:RNA polymerase sigma-70 factor (ECF subfamily)
MDPVRSFDALAAPFSKGAAGPREASGRAGFAEVFDAHFDYVWHSLRRLGVREGDLEDLTHDVFLAVHRKLDGFDARRPLRPWLFGFAFRRASDYRRLARNRFEVLVGASGASDPEDGSPDPLERVIAREGLRLARAALETLELGRRAVFILHDLDEVPMPEIARELEIPLNTAYSRLRLARSELAATVRRLRKRGMP